MTDKIDMDDVRKIVRDIAHYAPDFVYKTPNEEDRTCLYWHKETNSPGCIYGHALKHLGVDVSTGDFEDIGIDSVLQELTGEANVPPWFMHVQLLQDSGISWGDAVADADEEYP